MDSQLKGVLSASGSGPTTVVLVWVRRGGGKGFKLVGHRIKESLYNMPRLWDTVSCWRVMAIVALLSQLS